jgi:hypothetical protein
MDKTTGRKRAKTTTLQKVLGGVDGWNPQASQ